MKMCVYVCVQHVNPHVHMYTAMAAARWYGHEHGRLYDIGRDDAGREYFYMDF